MSQSTVPVRKAHAAVGETLEQLREAHSRSKVLLFVGAGVSASLGLAGGGACKHGGVLGAIGFKYVGYLSTVPLALMLLGLSIVPSADDLTTFARQWGRAAGHSRKRY
jgi:hypothetical protein